MVRGYVRTIATNDIGTGHTNINVLVKIQEGDPVRGHAREGASRDTERFRL